MKKIICIVFVVLAFYACKQNRSGTSSVAETDGKTTYLLGITTADDEQTSLVCRFKCTAVPKKQTKKELCNSPIYVKESVFQSSSYLSNFLGEIESDSVFVKEISQNEQNTLSSVFKEEEQRYNTTGTYDSDLGKPEVVCASILKTNADKVLVSTPSNVDMRADISGDVSDESAPTGVLTEIKSLDEVKAGYPSLVAYLNVQTCPLCAQEYSMLKSNQAKFKGKMNIYWVALEKNNFSGNTNPCGGGIPQNQIFDKDKKQVSCDTGFKTQKIQSMIQSLSETTLTTITSVKDIAKGYPALVVFVREGCSPCVSEIAYLKTIVDNLAGKMNIYLIYNPGMTTPTNRFFDKNGNQYGNDIVGYKLKDIESRINKLSN